MRLALIMPQCHDNFYERRGLKRRLHQQRVRVMLALGGLMYAVAAWHDGDQCAFAGCYALAETAPWFTWAIGWTAYAILKSWIIVAPTPRPYTSLGVNGLGLFLYSSSAYALAFARWPILTLSIGSTLLALSALWVFYRTGFQPGDKGD